MGVISKTDYRMIDKIECEDERQFYYNLFDFNKTVHLDEEYVIEIIGGTPLLRTNTGNMYIPTFRIYDCLKSLGLLEQFNFVWEELIITEL